MKVFVCVPPNVRADRRSELFNPIDVGGQLRVDDFLIDKTTLERTCHQASLHSASPVLRPNADRRCMFDGHLWVVAVNTWPVVDDVWPLTLPGENAAKQVYPGLKPKRRWASARVAARM
jgi:hypothetical protein